MRDLIYIMGHKNPDTDSVCASIAYAELKNRLGIPAVPFRIGKVNRETEFVLQYFHVEIPDSLDSVRTQVCDLSMDEISPVSTDISIRTAWSIMQKNNVKVLPVAGEDGRLLGIVTLSDITDSYMNALSSNTLSAGNTPLQNIIDTLNAKLISGCEEDFRSTGKVVVAAMEPDSMEPLVERGDIVLVGDRKDAQAKAVAIGANCIILTCHAQIGPDVLVQAKDNHCIVMETGYDTFTSVRLINQSIPVGLIMTSKDMICFHMSDYIDSIRDRMLNTRYRSYPVIDDGGCNKGFISRYHLISQKRKKVILLDHNEKSQTVDGIEQAEILEIIDHHRLGDIQTGYPVYVRNEVVGSTSTLIANMYFENGIKPSKEMAGILCAAILSDTIRFKSPTSTYADAAVASKLARIAGIDTEEFAERMFRAASALEGMSPKEILLYDFKDYIIHKNKIGIGQISLSDPQDLQERKRGLLEYMSDQLAHNGYRLLLLMVTDIENEGSYLLFAGDDGELIRRTFGVEPGDKTVYLKGVVSRKKQVVPLLTNALLL